MEYGNTVFETEPPKTMEELAANDQIKASWRSRRMRFRDSSFISASFVAIFVAWATVALVSLAWVEHSSQVPHYRLRSPSASILGKIDLSDRYRTPPYWAHAFTLWRLLTFFACVTSIFFRNSAFFRSLRRIVLLYAVIIEVIILAYALLEGYLWYPLRPTYAPNRALGPDFCHEYHDEFPDRCSNTRPLDVKPPSGRNIWWKRSTIITAVSLGFTVLMLFVTWQEIELAPPRPRWTINQDARWANRLHLLILASFGILAALLLCWGVHVYSWPRVQVASPSSRGDTTYNQRGSLTYWILGVLSLVHIATFMSGGMAILIPERRALEAAHTFFIGFSILASLLLVVLCTWALYTNNSPEMPSGAAVDHGLCCVFDSVRGAACRGIEPPCRETQFTRRCEELGGTPDECAVTPHKGRKFLTENRGYQIVFACGGFVFAWATFLMSSWLIVLGFRAKFRYLFPDDVSNELPDLYVVGDEVDAELEEQMAVAEEEEEVDEALEADADALEDEEDEEEDEEE